MNLFKLAWKNIINKPLNLLLSLILFGLGIGLITFLLLLNTQLKENFDSNLADIDLVIGAKGSPLQMILCNMYHIDSPTGNISIKEAKPFLNPKHPLIKLAVPLSLGDSYRNYRIVGTTYDILGLYNARIKEGRQWKKDLEVTIGAAVADNTGLKIGDTFNSAHGFDDDEDLEHDHSSLKVVGILEGTGSVIDQLILTNTSSVWMVHDHNEERQDSSHQHNHSHGSSIEDILEHEDEDITSILIKYKSRTNFQTLSMPRNINENTDLQAASPAIEINRLYAMMGVGTDAIRWLAILIAFVSALSIFISLFKSMQERKYELSLMRVMGGSRRQLFFLILLEGILMAVMGYILGTALSHFGMELLSGYLKSGYRYSFTGWRWLSDEWIVLMVSILLGIIAALIPAIQASRTDINKTLSK